jgi:hypothetical protein
LYLCCYAGGNGCKLTLELLEFYLFISSQVRFVPHGLDQAVHTRDGGLGAETLLRDPKLQRWAEIFLIHEQLVLLNFLSP